MSRKWNVEESINKAISEGYVLTETGYGDYTEKESFYRGQGLMVISWYVPSDKEERMYKLFTREKKGHRKVGGITLVKKPNYAEMNVKTLRKICSEKKISGYSKMNKQQIIEVLAAS